jgi:hypothetical protein
MVVENWLGRFSFKKKKKKICFATLSGEARKSASPLSVAKQSLLRHTSWRRTSICFATPCGEAKKGYCFEIVSAKVYFLK